MENKRELANYSLSTLGASNDKKSPDYVRFYKKAGSTVIRHLGRDSHYAILHNALWVNANLFQTDLCRDLEPKDGVIV